jgi:hypothetical protein
MLACIDSLPKEQPFFVTDLPTAGHILECNAGSRPIPKRQRISKYLNALYYGDKSLGAFMQDACPGAGELIDHSKEEIQRTETYPQDLQQWIASQNRIDARITLLW